MGYDYFKRKDSMFADIRAEGFFESKPRDGQRIWKPNKEEAIAESNKLREKQAFKTRAKKRMLLKRDKLIAKLLRTRIGQRLAKLMKRGPIHQNKIDSASTARAIAQTQSLNDFFENLVAD